MALCKLSQAAVRVAILLVSVVALAMTCWVASPRAVAEETGESLFTPNYDAAPIPNGPQVLTNYGYLIWGGNGGQGPGNPQNNMGFGWCIDLGKPSPVDGRGHHAAWKKENAHKLDIPADRKDAAINVTYKLLESFKAGNYTKTRHYNLYLQALMATGPGENVAARVLSGEIRGTGYEGASNAEFTEMTGFVAQGATIIATEGGDVPEAAEDAYIVVVEPALGDGRVFMGAQRLITFDQRGLKFKDRIPEIGTQATLTGEGNVVKSGAVVEDVVSYSGLVPGKEYTLTGTLVDKANKDRALGSGELTFTPESESGEVTVSITVDKGVTEPVEAAVVFERLTSTEVDEKGHNSEKGKETPDDYSDDNQIAQHEDIDAESQTVHSEKTTETPSPTPSPSPTPAPTTSTTPGKKPKPKPKETPVVPDKGIPVPVDSIRRDITAIPSGAEHHDGGVEQFIDVK
ncbi:hypothetical protein CATYP_06010 [Corynebacterium atypicum]|uniref:T-Q ester bond containing domain-containing protein n=1 Tax=Corynebacterium atypicum TaxID=191610 RepID=A0ABM5QN63_9CORY|nr:hypothetical protein CATYP_06010 [Corynebacterium atypicum]